MTTPNPQTKFTYEDYLLFPDDGRRHELIDGEHYVTPAPGTKHQIASTNLAGLLHAYLLRTKVGRVLTAPTDVVLSDLDVVQPDLLFVSAARASIITEKNIQGPPDLVIEILSETTRRTDEIIKRKQYERFGVREYWIVDPEVETVKVYRLTIEERGQAPPGMAEPVPGYGRHTEFSREAGDHLSSPLLPDLRIPLAAIFE